MKREQAVAATRQGSHVEKPSRPVERLIHSRQRVIDHGEVFTPTWLVAAMLELVDDEAKRIDSRFLEPACGSGNFLVPVLTAKLLTVEESYGKSEFERRHYALLALMCVYGIELLQDNVVTCQQNLATVFKDYLDEKTTSYWNRAAEHVLRMNIIEGDALSLTTQGKKPLTFAEWAYVGKGRYKRRDFHLESLAGRSALPSESAINPDLGQNKVFKPIQDHKLATVQELANG